MSTKPLEILMEEDKRVERMGIGAHHFRQIDVRFVTEFVAADPRAVFPVGVVVEV